MKKSVITLGFVFLFFANGISAQQNKFANCQQVPSHFRYLASLAVASANELGRWDASRDYKWTGDAVVLSQQALARCKNNCQNIRAILELQSEDSQIIPYHEPTLFRDYLVRFYHEQAMYNQSHLRETHTLVPSHISEDKKNDCGLRYHYRAIKGDKFSIIKKQFPQNIDAIINKKITQPAFGIPLNRPDLLKNQLIFTGGERNILLDFEYTKTEVSIDPMGTMIDGGSQLSAICYGDAVIFDGKNDFSGKCCITKGIYGSYMKSTWNKKLFYCDIN